MTASGFTLSPGQQRLWQLGARDGHAAYRVELEFEAAAGITASDLSRALAQVAARHEILRMEFLVLPGMELPLQSPMTGAAWRLEHLPGCRHRLVLPALCADAQTALDVVRQAGELLAGAPLDGAGAEEPLPFTSVAQWQHEMLAEGAQTRLPAWPTPVAGRLPFQARVAQEGCSPRRCTLTLPAQLQASLARVDASDWLLAAWSALLLRLQGEPVPVGVLANGRSYEEVAAVPGPLARYLPVSLAGDAQLGFASRVESATQAVADVVGVQDFLPAPTREQHLQVGYAWTQATASSCLRTEVPFAWTERFLLLLSAHRHVDGGISLHFDYDAAACDLEALPRLEEEFFTLLRAALQEPQRAIASLPILGPRERLQVLEGMQGPTIAPPAPWQSVPEQVLATLRGNKGHIVIEDEARRLDGTALAAQVDTVARRLLGQGLERGAIVGVLLPRGIELALGILAIQRAGGAYLPLDTGYPEERLAFMLQDSGATVLLTSSALARELRAKPAFAPLLARIQVVAIDDKIEAGSNAALPQLAATDLAYLIYTSGSTGKPKGARISHGALANHMRWMLRELPLECDDAVLQKTPISFDASVWEIFAPLMAGARLVMAAPGVERDPDALAAAVGAHRITVLQVVPSMLRMLVEHRDFRSRYSLRRLCCGGEALDAELAKRALQIGVELVNLYGPSECTVQVVAERCSADDPVVAIGRPIDNTRIYILDPQGAPVPVGVRGEIHIAGASLAEGYHARPELDAERFLPDPFSSRPGQRMYRTGDLGAWRADGRIDCFGRADRQVKLRGYRIELGEIEAMAAAQPGVALAAAVIDRDAAGIDQLLCFYSVHAGARIEPTALKHALAAVLPDYMTPNWLVPVDAFPTAPSGKVDTAALLKLRPATATASRGPRDTIEMRLERIWDNVLNIGRAGIASSFFDLGGHSLLAVRLMAEIEKEFGHRLPLTSLFTAPTIAAQAALLRGEAIRIDPVLVPIRTGSKTQSPLVLVHPTGGSVLCYRDLASGLRTDRAIVALQDPGLVGEATYESVEELAGCYLDRLEPLVQDRRYLLAGWSSGGVIAYEIARQALARGHEVAMLCLIDSRMTRADGDTAAPGHERLMRSISRLIAHKAAMDCPDLSGLPFDEALAQLLQLAREADFLPAEASTTDIAKLFQVFERNVTVVSRYEAKPLPRRTLIMQATEALPEGLREAAAQPVGEDMLLRWEQLCFAHIRPIAADHLSIMEPPRLHSVLEALDGELAEVERLHRLPQLNLLPMLGL